MKTKRTAGERRYRGIKRKTEIARQELARLQSSMQIVDGEGKQLRQMRIIQTITEVIERLNG